MKNILLIGSGHYGEFIQSALKNMTATVKVVDGFVAHEYDFISDISDLVVVATPNHAHYPIVRRALEAGKSVLCEKPLALDVTEVHELYALAVAKGVVLGVGFVLPQHPFYQWVREAQQTYGPIERLEICNHATEGELEPEWYWNREQSGGWFMVAEIHWLHLFSWLVDMSVDSVHGAEATVNGRTQQTWTSLTDSEGHGRLSVHHRLDMTQQTHWTKVEVFFLDGTQVVIDDWVPQSLRISDTEVIPKFPEFIEKRNGAYVDTRSRDERYRVFVQANIEQALQGESYAQMPVVTAHELALAAQRSADSIK